MRPPSLRTWLLGSRFTAPLILLGCAYHTWQWWQAGGMDNTGYFTLILLGVSAKAAHEVHSYRQWQAAWRAMAPGGYLPRWRPRPATIVAILGILAVGLLLVGTGNAAPSAQTQHAMMPIVILCAMTGMALLLSCAFYRLRARMGQRRQARLPVVALAIRRPIRRLISIRACYRRLPPYCQTLLRSGT